uniref:Uncharacterized protein n=1 Tax=Arundo donax TaxID=35708 RepID=A0A0A9BVU0_ARUDO
MGWDKNLENWLTR